MEPRVGGRGGWRVLGEVEGLFCLKEGFPELELIESRLGSASYHYVRDRGPNLMPKADRDTDFWFSSTSRPGGRMDSLMEHVFR